MLQRTKLQLNRQFRVIDWKFLEEQIPESNQRLCGLLKINPCGCSGISCRYNRLNSLQQVHLINRQWHLAHRIHLLLTGDPEALAIKLDHRVLKNTGTNDANEFLFCRFRQTAGIHLKHSVVSIRIRFRCDRSRYRTETKLFHLFLHHFIDKEIGKRLRAVPTINFCRTV